MGQSVQQAEVAQLQVRQVAQQLESMCAQKADREECVSRALLRDALQETHDAMDAAMSVRLQLLPALLHPIIFWEVLL
jgi:hypothetical protein